MGKKKDSDSILDAVLLRTEYIPAAHEQEKAK